MISDIKSDLLHEEYDQSKSKLKLWLNSSPEVRLVAILEQKNICKLWHFILSQTKFKKKPVLKSVFSNYLFEKPLRITRATKNYLGVGW